MQHAVKLSRRRNPQTSCATFHKLMNARTELLLPGALLVTIQAQLLAPFVFVDFCLAAFFD
jgi:hypothetical protein